MLSLTKLQDLFLEGTNIIDYLTDEGYTREEAILLSYDLQAGSYTKKFNQNRSEYEIYTQEISSVITRHVDLNLIDSVLDIGTGEGTVLSEVIKKTPFDIDTSITALDLSFSRLLWASENLGDSVNLVCASLFKTPFSDSFADLTLTVHALEPNGGREFEALAELWRISNRYLICFEPDFDSADAIGKQRMIKLGYIQNLSSAISKLDNCRMVANGLLNNSLNPLNPTGYFILERINDNENPSRSIISPNTGNILNRGRESLTDGQLEVFPVLQDISLLRDTDSIIAYSCSKLA